ncbi:hypothetical protein Arub01_54330 [Actinomadura rubrobrunea]|uniref:Uncharacterized protein n=1 Tax=Actinomadura rubrobrunea TaxID=115335 RepID=A0A9W6UZV8_9ACTN|nr:hypothetical protein [Actinomadura rubrobrunea]GLW67190.1 hypothetical protein Arub01_54330 [Actinomadura rubrobrunea]
MALHFVEQGAAARPRGQSPGVQEFGSPHDAIGFGFYEAVRGVLPHHMVIRDDKSADRHPYAADESHQHPRRNAVVMMLWRCPGC